MVKTFCTQFVCVCHVTKKHSYYVGYGARFGTDTENTQLTAKQGRGNPSDVIFFPCNFYKIF